MVFPVKYRKALLDNEVVEIIKETAIGIEERYENEIEAMWMDKKIIFMCFAEGIRSYHRGK
jgi:REP element-mobilizing transposase RayT